MTRFKLSFLLLSGIIMLTSFYPVSGQQLLNKYLDNLDPTIKLSFIIQDQEGEVLSKLNADKKSPSASIIKIPLLIYFMKNVEEGLISLNDSYQLKSSDKVGGSGELQFKPSGFSVTYEYLAKEMIRVSDNTATNIIIRRLGLKPFQDWLKAKGYIHTQLNRYMMDFEAIEKGQQNYLSPKEMNRLLLTLYDGDLLTKTSSLKVINYLKNCEDNRALPHQIPDGVAIAHKTGTLDYVRGDAGIIFGKKPIFITVLVENFSEIPEADSIISTIGKLAYLEFSR
ncbi:serine hydrolase [Cyclobacterium sp. 1_MG-2023]|nr:serine hydrolase [Cyclobacterium sp. 1_MG-2023]